MITAASRRDALTPGPLPPVPCAGEGSGVANRRGTTHDSPGFRIPDPSPVAPGGRPGGGPASRPSPPDSDPMSGQPRPDRGPRVTVRPNDADGGDTDALPPPLDHPGGPFDQSRRCTRDLVGSHVVAARPCPGLPSPLGGRHHLAGDDVRFEPGGPAAGLGPHPGERRRRRRSGGRVEDADDRVARPPAGGGWCLRPADHRPLLGAPARAGARAGAPARAVEPVAGAEVPVSRPR